jgi:uncharacterized membrane protein YfcA
LSGLEVAVCVSAIVIGTLVKAVTGMGFPLVAIPVISIFVSVEDAVSVVALPNVIMNAALCWHTRAEAPHTRDLPVLGFAGILGAVLGTWLLLRVPEELLMLGLAAIIFGYVGHSARRPEALLSPATTRSWSPAVGLAAGVMQGAVGISGPLVAAWIHAYRLTPNAFVFSVTLLFLLSGGTQLAVLVGNEMVTGIRLWLALAAIPLVLGSIPFGARLRERLDSALFDRAVLAVLLLSGASLVVRAVY